MKARIIRLGVILMIATVIAVIGLMYLQEPPPTQFVTLSGQEYRFIGVTCGTKHGHGPFLARLVDRAPPFVSNFLQRSTLRVRIGTAQSFKTPQPALAVWFEPVFTNRATSIRSRLSSIVTVSSPQGAGSDVQAMLADEQGVIAGKAGEIPMRATFPGVSSGPFPIFFPVVPRRSRMIECCFYTVPAIPEGARREVGKVRFPNPFYPLYGRFPDWRPEALPVGKRVGDFEVRLEHFTSGVPTNGLNPLNGHPSLGAHLTKFRPAAKGEEAKTGFDFSLHATNATGTDWVLHAADLRDPGGNHVRSSWPTGDQWSYPFLWGSLWPNETAWQLRLEFKRRSGFAPAELVTFTNVPFLKFGVGGPIVRTNIVHGHEFVLTEYTRSGRSNYAGVSPLFRIEASDLEDTAIDFVKLVTDQGETMVMREMSEMSPATREPLASPVRVVFFGKDPPTNATTVNLTWCIQKTRSVEFFVQPQQP
jgi:hypothetical protein